MKIDGRSDKNLRGELALWWSGAKPLVRRIGVRWATVLAVLAGLWLTGANYSPRYATLAPNIGPDTAPLEVYLTRGSDIPKEENAATLYFKANSLLTGPNHGKVSDEEAQRLNHYFDDGSHKFTQSDWEVMKEFAAESETVMELVRRARQRPRCVFPVVGNCLGSHYGWYPPDAVAACLALRTRVAAHWGDAPAWRQAMKDLVGFVETIEKDPMPVFVEMQRRTLAALLQSFEEACTSGVAAADDAFLAALDGKLAALRPMEAFEPLLKLAWSVLEDSGPFPYFWAYPRYISQSKSGGWPSYDENLGIPYCAAGFSARDRILYTEYVSELLGIIRSGQPDAHLQAWKWMDRYSNLNGRMNREFAPRYNQLCRLTARHDRHGSPGTLYTNLACIRMARAMTAVIRQGRDEQGRFREAKFLDGLLRAFPSPKLGLPILCSSDPNHCRLTYRGDYAPWYNQGDEDFHVEFTAPPGPLRTAN